MRRIALPSLREAILVLQFLPLRSSWVRLGFASGGPAKSADPQPQVARQAWIAWPHQGCWLLTTCGEFASSQRPLATISTRSSCRHTVCCQALFQATASTPRSSRGNLTNAKVAGAIFAPFWTQSRSCSTFAAGSSSVSAIIPSCSGVQGSIFSTSSTILTQAPVTRCHRQPTKPSAPRASGRPAPRAMSPGQPPRAGLPAPGNHLPAAACFFKRVCLQLGSLGLSTQHVHNPIHACSELSRLQNEQPSAPGKSTTKSTDLASPQRPASLQPHIALGSGASTPPTSAP